MFKPIRSWNRSKVWILAGIVVLGFVGSAFARSISLTSAGVSHYWYMSFFRTEYEGAGDWTPDAGDTPTGVVIEKAPSGTDNFTAVTMDGQSVGSDAWSGGAYTLHNGASVHVRGGVIYTPSGGALSFYIPVSPRLYHVGHSTGSGC